MKTRYSKGVSNKRITWDHESMKHKQFSNLLLTKISNAFSYVFTGTLQIVFTNTQLHFSALSFGAHAM